MIIDEGFLSNAKKIAETQPQQSEVKVPEIKRENFGYHIKISFIFSRYLNPNVVSKMIFRNIIFKEYGNVYEKSNTEDKKYNIYDIEFDSDMFITGDSVYYFIYSLVYSGVDNRLDISITENSGKKIFTETFDSINLFTIQSQPIKKNSLIFQNEYAPELVLIKKTFNKFGLSERYFFKWMNRNDIINVVLNDGLYCCILYPISIKNPEKFYEILKSAGDVRTADIFSNKKYICHNKKTITDEIIKNNTRDFILCYDNDFNIIIQTTYPTLTKENEYIWSVFKIIRISHISRKEYSYMHEIINESKNRKIIFKRRYNITEEDQNVIDGNSIRNGIKETPGINGSMTINIEYNESPDSKTLTKEITDSNFIKEYENIDNEITYDSERYYLYKVALDCEFSINPENVYEFVQIFKYSNRMIISIYYRGDCTEIDTKNLYNNKIYQVEPDRIYNKSKDSLIYSLNEVMNMLGIEEKDIIKWNIENGIVMIKNINIENYMEKTSAAYIECPEDIITDYRDLSIEYAHSLNNYDMFDYDDNTANEIIRIIRESGTHKFIILTEETESEDYPSEKGIYIEITTLYPIMYKGKYIYPTYTNEIYKSDENYEYYKKISTKLKRYRLWSGNYKTSGIKFANIKKKQVIK